MSEADELVLRVSNLMGYSEPLDAVREIEAGLRAAGFVLQRGHERWLFDECKQRMFPPPAKGKAP